MAQPDPDEIKAISLRTEHDEPIILGQLLGNPLLLIFLRHLA